MQVPGAAVVMTFSALYAKQNLMTPEELELAQIALVCADGKPVRAMHILVREADLCLAVAKAAVDTVRGM